MSKVRFTNNLHRHVSCQPCEVEASTVREALDAAFSGNPLARSYVLDEHGSLRRRMVIFVDGLALRDRDRQSDPVGEDSEIYIMQALSGG